MGQIWDSQLVDRLRYFINDLDPSSPVWTDVQLKKFVMLGLIQTSDLLRQWNIGFYQFDTAAMTITPDPMASSGTAAFGNLAVLKAASFIAAAELKKQSASAGYKIQDDKSTIDTTQVIANIKYIKEMYDKAYDQAIKDFKEGNKYTGSAILSPYSSSNGTPFFGVTLYGNEGDLNRWFVR